MRSTTWVAALAGLLVLALSTATAQPTTFFSVPASGDADINSRINHFSPRFGYIDANGNGAVDSIEPDEPVYIDVDASSTVTFGDVRLVPFLNYPAGSAVDVSNQDFGATLLLVPGWFATDPASNWWLDSDRSRSVTVGDVRLAGTQGTKVDQGDSAMGTSLTLAQQGISESSRVAWGDTNNNNRRDVGERIYLDLDAGGTVGIGEPRIMATQIVVDVPVTQEEVDQISSRLNQLQSLVESLDRGGSDPIAPPPPSTAASAASVPGWIPVLTIINLVVALGVGGVVGMQAMGKLPAPVPRGAGPVVTSEPAAPPPPSAEAEPVVEPEPPGGDDEEPAGGGLGGPPGSGPPGF